jgi:hypothetical protein
LQRFPLDALLDVSPKIAKEVQIRAQELYDALHRIATFDPMMDRAKDQIPGYQSAFEEANERLYSAIVPVVAINDLLTRDKTISEAMANAKASVDKLINMEREGVTALSALKTATGASGTVAYAGIFEKEFDEYTSQGRRWFWTIWGIAIVSIAAVVAIHLWLPLPSITVVDIVRYSSTKLLVMSILYIVLAIAIRNYSAAKHNAVINRHRACAMQTFEAFREAGEREETKDAVLKQATEAIFSMQRTGFISKDAGISAPQQIIEFLSRAEKKT